MPYSIVIIVIFLLLSSSFCRAQGDSTKYNFMIPGNAYTTDGYTITWLAYMYDGIYSYGDHAFVGESLFDTCQSWGKGFVFGPYNSTQEFSLYVKDHSEYTYDYRLTVSNLWYVSLMESYMSSVGCDRESLYVHILDDALSITNSGTTRANTSIQSEILRRRRFSLQYWNNDVTDTGMYPQGYCWLGNGFCDTTLDAAGYAYVQRFVADTTSYSDGTHRHTCFFADNQKEFSTGPRLPTYYTINSSSGGGSSGMDWIEVGSIQSSTDSIARYYGSTLRLDSAIAHDLDSACDANGISRVMRFSNCDKGNAIYNGHVLDAGFDLFWETSFEYLGKDWLGNEGWQQKDSVAHLVRNDPNRHLLTEWRLDALWNAGQWYTKDRVCYAAMAWFLTLWDTTIYASPVRWTDPTSWHECFQIDIGDPVADTNWKRDTTGSSNTTRIVLKRLFNNGGTGGIAVFRTAYGGDPGPTNDPIWVKLWDALTTDTARYYQIDGNRDTSGTAVDSIQIYPMQGWIGVAAAGSGPASGKGVRGRVRK